MNPAVRMPGKTTSSKTSAVVSRAAYVGRSDRRSDSRRFSERNSTEKHTAHMTAPNSGSTTKKKPTDTATSSSNRKVFLFIAERSRFLLPHSQDSVDFRAQDKRRGTHIQEDERCHTACEAAVDQ